GNENARGLRRYCLLTRQRLAGFDSPAQISRFQAAVCQLGTLPYEICVRLDRPPNLRTSDTGSPCFLSASSLQPFNGSTILLNNLLQMVRHFRQRFEPNWYRAIRRFRHDRIHFRKALVFFRIIFAELRASTFFSLQRGARYSF